MKMQAGGQQLGSSPTISHSQNLHHISLDAVFCAFLFCALDIRKSIKFHPFNKTSISGLYTYVYIFVASSFLRFFLDHTQRHTTVGRTFSGRVISSSQRPLPDNTEHSQQTNINAPGGIRNHNLSRRAATDLRLRLRGHWDQQLVKDKFRNFSDEAGGTFTGQC